MTPAARLQAAIECLDEIIAGAPAEKVLTGWARRSRFAGSKDRAAVRDHVFDVLRMKRSCFARGGAHTGRGAIIGLLRGQGVDIEALFTGGYGPEALREEERNAGHEPNAQEALDLPDWLCEAFEASLGADHAEVAEALRHRAEVVVRVNTRAIPREGAIAALSEAGIAAKAHPDVPTAIVLGEGARRLSQSAPYHDGLVELQDGASQAAVLQLPLSDGMRVLDYCAGGGGKSLAMAARARLDLVAHDAYPQRMKDIAPRAERAGVRIQTSDTNGLNNKEKFDLVLCDAPCSGSGTWRRTPDAKWRLTAEDLRALSLLQAQILQDATRCVAPDGILAYATCSVLRDENQTQIAAFLADHPQWRLIKEHVWRPGMGVDGFYLAMLRRG